MELWAIEAPTGGANAKPPRLAPTATAVTWEVMLPALPAVTTRPPDELTLVAETDAPVFVRMMFSALAPAPTRLIATTPTEAATASPWASAPIDADSPAVTAMSPTATGTQSAVSVAYCAAPRSTVP